MRIFIVLIMCLSLACAEEPDMIEAETIYINLDLEPSQRWKQANLPDRFCRNLNEFQEEYFNQLERKHYRKDPEGFEDLKQAASFYFNTHLKGEVKEELASIAEICDLSITFTVLYNFAYELGILGCTSIVSLDQFGETYLATNLDYDNYLLFASLTFKAIFTQRGLPVVTANFLFGYYGYTRGINSHDVMMALNQRSFPSPRPRGSYLTSLLTSGAITNTLVALRSSHISSYSPSEQLSALLGELGSVGFPFYLTLASPRGDSFTYTHNGDASSPRVPLRFFSAPLPLVQTNADFDKTDRRRALCEEISARGVKAEDVLWSQGVAFPKKIHDAKKWGTGVATVSTAIFFKRGNAKVWVLRWEE